MDGTSSENRVYIANFASRTPWREMFSFFTFGMVALLRFSDTPCLAHHLFSFSKWAVCRAIYRDRVDLRQRCDGMKVSSADCRRRKFRFGWAKSRQENEFCWNVIKVFGDFTKIFNNSFDSENFCCAMVKCLINLLCFLLCAFAFPTNRLASGERKNPRVSASDVGTCFTAAGVSYFIFIHGFGWYF